MMAFFISDAPDFSAKDLYAKNYSVKWILYGK
jgi:hypothetical protein